MQFKLGKVIGDGREVLCIRGGFVFLGLERLLEKEEILIEAEIFINIAFLVIFQILL